MHKFFFVQICRVFQKYGSERVGCASSQNNLEWKSSETVSSDFPHDTEDDDASTMHLSYPSQKLILVQEGTPMASNIQKRNLVKLKTAYVVQ